jgi:hypothetical protein
MRFTTVRSEAMSTRATYLQRFVDESDQIRPAVGYGRILDEVQEMRISDFVHEHAVRVYDALAVFVIGAVDLIDFIHVRLARVPRQHFPVVLDYALQRVLRSAQQLQRSRGRYMFVP